MNFRARKLIFDLLIPIAAVFVIVAMLAISKFADYKACEKNFPDELWTCVFSNKYRVDR